MQKTPGEITIVNVTIAADSGWSGHHYDGSVATFKTITHNGTETPCITSGGLRGRSIEFNLSSEEVAAVNIIQFKQMINEKLGLAIGCDHMMLVRQGKTMGYDQKSGVTMEHMTLGECLLDQNVADGGSASGSGSGNGGSGGSTIKISLVMAPPRLCITLVEPRDQSGIKREKNVIKQPFDPNETPTDVKRWCLSQDFLEEGTVFKPMCLHDGTQIDDDTSMGDQGVPIGCHERKVYLRINKPLCSNGSSSTTPVFE